MADFIRFKRQGRPPRGKRDSASLYVDDAGAFKTVDEAGAVADVGGGGGGGSSPGASRWIDCGVVDMDAAVRAGHTVLVAAAEGRLIAGVRFTPDGVIDPPSTFYFITPNTVGFSGAGFVGGGNAGSDALGMVVSSSNTPLPYSSSSSEAQIQILDGGPLVAASGTPSREFFAPGVWQAGHAYALGDAIIDRNDHVHDVILNGVSGGSEPVWDDSGGTTSDGTVQWEDLGAVPQGAVHVFAEVIELGPGGFTPPQPASLVFAQQPTDADAEATVAPTVTVQILDANGDPYAGMYPMGMNLRLFGDGTFTAVGAGTNLNATTDPATGIASFPTLAITEPGTYRVQATLYPSINVPAVLSDPFTISAP